MLGVFAMHATLFLELSGHHVAGRDYLVEAGRVSVAVFFVLTGFLLYLPFALARLSGAPPPALKAYYVRRGARIMPAYWVVLLVCALLFGWTYVFTPDGVVTYFGFLQVFSDDTLARGLFPAWAIDVLVFFYVLLPGWSWLMRRIPANGLDAFGRTEAGMLLALALFGLAWKVWAYGETANLAGGNRPGAALVLALPAQVDLFAIGMGLAVVYLLVAARGAERPAAARAIERRPTIPWIGAALLFVLIVAIDPWLNRGVMTDADDPELIAAHLLGGVFAVALLLPTVFGTAKRGLATRLLATRALVLFGTVSYGFFLWHGPVLQELHGELAPLGPRRYVLAALALALAAGSLSYVLVERPVVRLGRRLPRRGTAGRAAPAPALRRVPVVAPAILAVVAAALVAERVLDEGLPDVRGLQLARASGHAAVVWPGGSATITPGAVSGAVERMAGCGRTLAVHGWAADRRSGRAAERVVAFRGERLVAAGVPDRRRMDEGARGGQGLQPWGFVIAGPDRGGGRASGGQSLRVFAVAGDRASRLPVRAADPTAAGDGATTLVRDGRGLAIRGPAGTARLRDGAMRGFVDHIVAWGPALALQGWAADVRHRRLPDCVLVFEGRRLLAAGPPTVRRPDIAVTYSVAVEHAGFRFGVPMGVERAKRLARPRRVRVFAVLGTVASELPVAASP